MAGQVSLFGRARYFLRSYIVHGRVRVILQYLFAKFQSLFIQPTILPYSIVGRFMRSQVFLDTDYFTGPIKPFFDVQSVTPEAYGFQTAVILKKK